MRLVSLASAGLLAACGHAGEAVNEVGTAPSDPSVVTATSSTLPPSPASTAPPVASCEDGSSPAVAGYRLVDGAITWSHCSVELAWRELLGSSGATLFMTSVSEETTPPRAVLHPSVVALDAATGTERWRRALAPVGSFGRWGRPPGPTAGGGIIVLPVADEGSGATIVIGADAQDGSERWRIDASQLDGASDTLGPIANTEDVSILASDRTVAGVDRRSGTLRWSLPLQIVDSAGVGVARATSAVVQLDGGATTLVILPTVERPDPGLYPPGNLPPSISDVSVAVDATSGAERWRAPVLHHPAAADEVLVGYVYEEVPGPDIGASFSVPPMRRPVVRAVDATDGTTRWTQPGGPTYGDIWAVGAGIVLVTVSTETTGMRAPAYDLASGAVRWEQRVAPGAYRGEPHAVEGNSVLLLGGGLVSALDAADGSLQWSTATPTGSLESHLVTDHTLAYVTFNTMPWRD